MTPTLNFSPDDRLLRQFGFIGLFGFGLLAGAAAYEKLIFSMGLGAARLPVAVTLGSLAGCCLLFSLVRPRLNKALYVGLSVLTYPIGLVVSYLIMATLFFLVIGPIGFLVRTFGADPMQRRLERGAVSYWTRIERKNDSERYFRQF
jgi:hypothetical protein